MAAKKLKKKRSPRKTMSASSWRKIMFGDLHVHAPTIDRCILVLRRIRELAVKYRAQVVCKGDFWHQRGILSVRQTDMIQDELDEHKKAGVEWILIPGNHDQVTQDGRIHGLRIFEGYSNIQVVTEPLVVEDERVAYLPWREDPKEQRKLFRDVPKGYTVFGHGEIKGATANNGHKAEGRFTSKDVSHLRAVYLSHYHKRHQIGKNVWYTGSPYEQDMGERNMPHGVGYVTDEKIEPYFFDFDDLPKHWRFTWPQDEELFSAPREQDVVEVLAPREGLRSGAFLDALNNIEATDVRPLPLSTSTTRGAPTFALSIHDAVDRLVEEHTELDQDELRATGHSILKQVADFGTIVPLGNTVHIEKVEIDDFCAVRGHVALPLDKLGTVLLRGRMGSGKTAITDAITWCFYGTTAPRKPGTSGASIRSDGVIHDDAKKTKVAVTVSLDDGKDTYLVVRSRKRGKSSRIELFKNGEAWSEEGITDSQDLIHRIVGLDNDLWRACVSLGQGEVQNFVTDAQKRRTELLERAFRLGACPYAQKEVRKRVQKLEKKMKPLQEKLITLRGKIEQAKAVDYDKESKEWERDRKSAISSANAVVSAAKLEVTQLDSHLHHEVGWQKRKERLLIKRSEIHTKLEEMKPSANPGHLHAQIGAFQNEKGNLEKSLSDLVKKRDDMHQASSTSRICPTCFQPIPAEQIEQHITEIEQQITSLNAQIGTTTVQIQNLQTELGQFTMEKTDTSGVSAQLKEAEAHLDEANKALNALSQIRLKRQQASDRWQEALDEIEAWKVKTNPWNAKKAEAEAEVVRLRDEEQSTLTALGLLEKKERVLRFWDDGFGPKGIPVLVLRTALYELEMHANAFLARIMEGRLYTELAMLDDDLDIKFYEYNENGEVKERPYVNLSGGQRRCVQLGFAPFALSEMIFSRTGVRIPFLVIDELTTHLDPETKPIVCDVLRELGRDTVLVIDHDPQVQGSFDVVYDVSRGGKMRRAA